MAQRTSVSKRKKSSASPAGDHNESPGSPAPAGGEGLTDDSTTSARSGSGVTPGEPDIMADLAAAGQTDDEVNRDGDYTDDEVIKFILECRREAYDARRHRMRQNHMNRDAYMGLQDWSHKHRGQSTEFLPKTGSAAEQFRAFVKKALISFGDWFSVSLSDEVKPYITDAQIRQLMKYFFDHLPASLSSNNQFDNLENRIADGALVGLLESTIVLKVYGKDLMKKKFKAERGAPVFDIRSGMQTQGPMRLSTSEEPEWHLCIDLVRNEDYFPDPTGRGLYEIHEVERDYIDIEQMAESGIYDKAAVEAMKNEDFPKPEYERRRPQQLGQDRSVPPAVRRRATITEFWGTLLGEGGRVISRNCVATLGNKKHLLRRPEDNPFWHGESIFVTHPLVRVPFSVLHKAIMDGASYLNYAINEMFNLILDGGIADVWGIKQLRINQLADPKQVEGGIPQGTTLHVKDTLPEGTKVLEKVAEGSVPQDSMAILEMLNSEFMEAALTNEIKLGSLPGRPVKATEVVTSENNQNVTLGSISMDLERGMMEPLLRKSWLTILQHIKMIPQETLEKVIGQRAAYMLSNMESEEVFAQLAQRADFKVHGLTQLMSAAQDFQKMIAFLQVASQNPVLMQAFMTQYSPRKILKLLMKLLNINPDNIALDPDEQKNLPQVLQQIQMFSQILGGGQDQGTTVQNPSQNINGQTAALSSGVNQQIQPLTGLKVTS